MNTTRDMTHLDLANPIASTLLVAWHWPDSTIPLMQSASRHLTKLAEAEHRFFDKHYAVAANMNLSETGKTSAREEAFNATLAPIYRDLQETGQSMNNMIGTLKANSLPRTDPADFGAALARSDIRRIFLGMSSTQRTVAIVSNPSVALAAALLEFPPELMGLSAENVSDLTAAFGESAYPEKAKDIAELSDGLEVVKLMMRMVVVLAADKLRRNDAQVETLIWGGTLPDSKRL